MLNMLNFFPVFFSQILIFLVFKKECLVEFETEEGSSKAVAVKEVEYGGAKLQIISK